VPANPQASSEKLDRLLAQLRGRIVRLLWLHGFGTVLAVAAGWLLFAFLSDLLLHLPAPIRVFHTVSLVLLPAYFVWREGLRLTRRVPDGTGLAQLVERAHPTLHELLVSAIQLGERLRRGQTGSESPVLIERVVAEAEREAQRLDVGPVLAPSGPRRRAALGLGAGLVTLLALSARPDLTSIFLARMWGTDVPWPQRTHLTVEIPGLDQEEADGELRVRVARGSDVPVIVRALGVVPDEVTFHHDDGRSQVVPTGRSTPVRARLSAVQEDTVFHVTGGDDRDREPRVRLIVLQPPDITGLAVRVVPPAYSGLEERVVLDRDVEVLQGSRLTIHALCDPPDARGVARLLPQDSELELVPMPFPAPPDAPGEGRDTETAGGPAPEARPGLGFEWTADASFRYRFELVDDTGLPNPDPGLFGVQVFEDKRPEVLVIAPGRVEIDVVAGGALPLRTRVRDDFGVAGVRWEVRGSGSEEPLLSAGALEPTPVVPLEDVYRGSAHETVVARARLEVNEIAGLEPLVEGQQLALQVFALDNREPEANESASAPIRLRVVSVEDFMRRLRDRLARAGEQVHRLSDLQEEKLLRTREILTALSSDEMGTGELSDLGALLAGQRRVQGDARALSRDLAAVTESLLYARIDDRAGALLDALDEALATLSAPSASADRAFQVEPWNAVAQRYARGELGTAGLAGQLVSIVALGLAISEEHSTLATEALVAARDAAGPAAARDAVARAYEQQQLTKESVETLLELLAEWDNFQSILSLTRDILGGQRSLLERTRQYAKEH